MAIKKYASKNKISCPTNMNAGLLYDSYLHFPQLEILIPPSIIEFVDIHGLGEEDDADVPGLLYGVVNSVTASHFLNDSTPDALKCNELSTETRLVNYIDIFGKAKCLECLIQFFLIDKGDTRSNIQHDTVTVNDIIHRKVLKCPYDNKVWIILARTSVIDIPFIYSVRFLPSK